MWQSAAKYEDESSERRGSQIVMWQSAAKYKDERGEALTKAAECCCE